MPKTQLEAEAECLSLKKKYSCLYEYSRRYKCPCIVEDLSLDKCFRLAKILSLVECSYL